MNQSRQVIVNGSAHEIPLPAGMIHTVCTSPPYYSLRSYAGQQEIDWPEVSYRPMPGAPRLWMDPVICALGLEPTPEAYIGHLVLCFREVRRVLREDGTCWIVIGDSYSGSSQTGGMNSKEGSAKRAARMFKNPASGQRATACGTSGKEPGDSQGNDHPSGNLCGACRAVQSHKSRSDVQPAPTPAASPSAPNLGHKESESDHLPTSDSKNLADRNSTAIQDQRPVSIPAGEQPPAVQVSTTPSASHLSQEPLALCAACGQMLAPPRSSSSGARGCEHKTVSHDAPQIDAASILDQQACIPDSEATGDASDHHTTGTVSDSFSYPYPTTLSHHLQVKPSLQQGDLMLIPHRLALALQGDGWLVRNDVVWAKVAPMPESVSGWRWERCRVKVKGQPFSRYPEERGGQALGGPLTEKGLAQYSPCPGCPKCSSTGGYVLRRGSWRHTRAHETILMLAKGMGYYSDQERVREANAPVDWKRAGNSSWQSKRRSGETQHGNGTATKKAGRESAPVGGSASGRNPRSVLTPRPESFKGSHYAVFPRTLISPLLRATAPTRVCPVCGAPWCPVVERTDQAAASHKGSYFDRGKTGDNGEGRVQPGDRFETMATGHRPTCTHNADPIPGWALDPFAGTGTTLAVCAELGVNGIGLDISPQYLDEHAKPRIGLTPSGALDELPLFEGMI